MTAAALAQSSFQEKLDMTLLELRASLIFIHSGIIGKLLDATSNSQEECELSDALSDGLNGALAHDTKGQQQKNGFLPPRPDGKQTAPWIIPPPPPDHDLPRLVSYGDDEEVVKTLAADDPSGILPCGSASLFAAEGGSDHRRASPVHMEATKRITWMEGSRCSSKERSCEEGQTDPTRTEDSSTPLLENVPMTTSLPNSSNDSDIEHDNSEELRPRRKASIASAHSACSSTVSSMFADAVRSDGTLSPEEEEAVSDPLAINTRHSDAGAPDTPSYPRAVVSKICPANNSRSSSLEVPASGFGLPGRSSNKSHSSATSQRSPLRTSSTTDSEDEAYVDRQFSSQMSSHMSPTASRKSHAGSLRSMGSVDRSLQQQQPLDLLPAWRHGGSSFLGSASKQSLHSFQSMPSSYMMADDDESEDGGDLISQRCEKIYEIWQALIVSPTAKKRLVWDLISMVCLLWDCITIPLQVFDRPESDLTEVMAWMTRVFWTFDIPASFFTGCLLPNGDVEHRPACIAMKYSRSWFIIDLFVVGSDWAIGITEAMGDSMRLGAGRLMRMFRIFRLMRIMKLPEKVAQVATMHENIRSEQVILVLGVVKIICMVLGCAHLIACFWYGVGKAANNAHLPSWLDEGYFDADRFGETYCMSFHWSLAQFVGGTEIVEPRNVYERIYAINVVLMTFVISAAVVSSLTSSMTRIQFLTGQRTAQLAALRRYLADHNIPRKLMVRVQRNAQHALAELQRNVPESEVELLKFISEPLRVELHYEEHNPILALHPLFNFYKDANSSAMRKVCHEACKSISYSDGDVLFTAGEVPSEPKMFILTSGALEYQREMSCQYVSSGWFAEAVLWCVWVHRGIMKAKADCRLLTVDAQIFQELGNQFQHSNISIHPALYAFSFQALLREDREMCSDVIDPQHVQNLVNTLADAQDIGRSSRRVSVGRPNSRSVRSRRSLGPNKEASVIPEGGTLEFSEKGSTKAERKSAQRSKKSVDLAVKRTRSNSG